uniref:Kinase n=1 Tax=Sexangularia sp. CB-2014 TaxID=1486929 RepID=A0A7S1V2E9_9EUKA
MSSGRSSTSNWSSMSTASVIDALAESTRTISLTRQNVSLFPFQVSGHDVMFRVSIPPSKPPRKSSRPSSPVPSASEALVKLASQRELKFYGRVARTCPELLRHIPTFEGFVVSDELDEYAIRSVMSSQAARLSDEARAAVSPWSLSVLNGEVKKRKVGAEYIALTDLTLPFSKPCALDCKLGTAHHSQDRQVTKPVKYETAKTLGYCIGGVLMYDGSADGPLVHYDKYFGRQLTDTTIVRVLQDFLFCCTSSSYLRSQLVQAFLTELEPILQLFKEQEMWRFHSTSLLLMYDATLAGPVPRVTVKLVDFAHAYLNTGREPGRELQVDAGCILGITNLMAAMRTIGAAARGGHRRSPSTDLTSSTSSGKVRRAGRTG